jgi:hypothetical protein
MSLAFTVPVTVPGVFGRAGFTAPTAEEEHHSSRGPGLSDVNVRE